MKKYKITSDHFSGNIEVWYNLEGALIYLNMTGIDCSTKLLGVFYNLIPNFMKAPPKETRFSLYKIEEVA